MGHAEQIRALLARERTLHGPAPAVKAQGDVLSMLAATAHFRQTGELPHWATSPARQPRRHQ